MPSLLGSTLYDNEFGNKFLILCGDPGMFDILISGHFSRSEQKSPTSFPFRLPSKSINDLRPCLHISSFPWLFLDQLRMMGWRCERSQGFFLEVPTSHTSIVSTLQHFLSWFTLSSFLKVSMTTGAREHFASAFLQWNHYWILQTNQLLGGEFDSTENVSPSKIVTLDRNA